jgi:hypothetical protein
MLYNDLCRGFSGGKSRWEDNFLFFLIHRRRFMPLGGLITLAVLLPNLLVLALRPEGVPPRPAKQNQRLKMVEIIERIGQVGVFAIPFFYPLPQLRNASVDALAVMGLAIGIYYAGWARYALKGHRFVLLFAPLLGIPLPMAISPVFYFGAAAIFLGSWPLAVAVLFLAIGHLIVSQGEWQRCKNTMFLQTG